MIPVLLKLGPITVYSYGLMMALGFVAADLVIAAECRRRGITPEYASSLVVWAAVAGLVGARIWDIWDNFPLYMQHPWSMIFSGSGFVWYGGFVGGAVAIYFVARRYGVRFLPTADMVAPGILIGHAFGRMGCLLSGDGDWGLPTKMPWGMAFPNAIVGWNSQTVLKLNAHDQLVSGFYPGVRVHPTPIYEAVLYVAIFAFLWSIRKRNRVEGRIFYLFLILAGAARFVVEFWRINPRVLWGLSEYQLFSILMVAVGTVAYLLTLKREPETAAAKAPSKEALRA
jgi:phosphatidylglycerol:prolipoprotein diacylglycerol transferase